MRMKIDIKICSSDGSTKNPATDHYKYCLKSVLPFSLEG